MAFVNEGADLEKLKSYWLGMVMGETGKRTFLPVQYMTNKLAAAKAMAALIAENSCYAVPSISAVVARDAQAVIPVDPGSEPAHETFNFRVQTAENGPYHPQRLFVPGFVTTGETAAERAASVQAFGEAILALLIADAGITDAKFTGTTGSRRR